MKVSLLSTMIQIGFTHRMNQHILKDCQTKEKKERKKTTIELLSIQYWKSSCRQGIMFEIRHAVLRLHHRGLDVSFLWVPAHDDGVEFNETVDILAKQSFKLACQYH